MNVKYTNNEINEKSVIEVWNQCKRNYVDVCNTDDDKDSDTDEADIVKMKKSEYSVPNEIEIVKVTPPPKKRVKTNQGGAKESKLLMEGKKGVKKEETDDESDEVEYFIIKTLRCNDGSNVLTRIPGGYTEHWKCPVYIEMMHRSLYYEIKVWCNAIRDFVDNIDERLHGTPYDCGYNPKQGNHIKDFVKEMERIVRNKVLKKRSIVLHSLHYEGIMHAFPGCTKAMAKLVHSFCRSRTFHVRFFVVLAVKEMTYDLGTLFSAGYDWHFGQWDEENQPLVPIE